MNNMEKNEQLEGFFKKVLVLAGIVFSVHLGLTLFSMIVEIGMIILPILYLPDLTVPEFFSYIPVLFIFDLGLVSLIAFLLWKMEIEIKLKWLEKMKRKLNQPQKLTLLLMILAFIILLFLRWQFGTIFVFISILNKESISILTLESLQWLSNIIIISVIISIIVYYLRFNHNSELIITFKKIIDLIILWFIIRYPYQLNEAIFQEYPALKNLLPLLKFLVMFIVGVVVYEMIRSFINIILKTEEKF